MKMKKVKKIIKITALSLLGIFLVCVITAGVILFGRIATVSSVKTIGESMHTVNFQQDYGLDRALDADIRDEKGLFGFICDEMFFGCQVAGDLDQYACSAFLTQTEDGQHLAGRNFDYDNTETLAVYTHPQNGYASIGMAVLNFLKVGKPNSISPDSLEGKIAMLASPYLCMDGVNEAGLNISILDLEECETSQDNGKPNLFIPVAVRLLLDRAATVEEAVALLEQYDVYSGDGYTQHLFISDKSGHAAVVEWTKDKMSVVESPVCTNFRLSTAHPDSYPRLCDRFATIQTRLQERPRNSKEDAMDILRSASVGWTQWSCVYDLDNFSVDIALDNRYDSVYTLTPKDF